MDDANGNGGPTRIWALSDLHQEWAQNAWDPLAEAPHDFDVLVAAGDVDTPLTGSLDWLASRFPGVPLVYVPGNHDFYLRDEEDKYTLWDQLERGRELADRRGITLLLDGAAEFGGTRFLGGTLWTNLRLQTHSRAQAHSTARKGMNDYKRIRRKESGRHRHLRTEETVEMHDATRAFLTEAMAVPFAGATVVVTHHAPHPKSLASPHADLNWCYASNLEHVIEDGKPELWLHGHIHRGRDYEVGETRIVANPRGHWLEPEARASFDPALVLEVSPGRVLRHGATADIDDPLPAPR
jgi:predicted phosphodiesterase